MSSGLSIEGTVKMPAGTTIQNAWIMARQISADGAPSGGNGRTMLERSGKFSIGGLKPGRYQLTMQMWGNGTSSQFVLVGGQDVAAGASGVTLSASAGATITGSVVDDSGRPVPGASVRASAEARGGRSMRANTNEKGEFELAALEDGKSYTLRVTARGKIGTQQKGVTAGTASVRLTVRAGVSASGTVADASGQPLKNSFVYFKPVGRSDLSNVQSRTNGDGAFTVSGMDEGVTYEATVRLRTDNTWKTLKAGTIRGGETGMSLQASE